MDEDNQDQDHVPTRQTSGSRSKTQALGFTELLGLGVKMRDQKKKGQGLSDDVDDELSASDESDSEPEEGPNNNPFDPDLDADKDDDIGEILAPAVGDKAQSPFSLKGGNSAFSNRSQSIFDCLDGVAQQTASTGNATLNQEKAPDVVFARPLPPCPSRKTCQPQSSCPVPAKKRGAPDYLVHPERWTRYSLEDVPETSDQDNRKAAHSFLSSLMQREQRDLDSQRDCPGDGQQKMVFSRPAGLPKEQLPDPPSAGKGKEKETLLRHLEEEEEDVEEAAGGKRKDQTVGTSREGERNEKKDTRGAAVGRPEKMEEANPGFTSFRKTKHKNYRKSSVPEDN